MGLDKSRITALTREDVPRRVFWNGHKMVIHSNMSAIYKTQTKYVQQIQAALALSYDDVEFVTYEIEGKWYNKKTIKNLYYNRRQA